MEAILIQITTELNPVHYPLTSLGTAMLAPHSLRVSSGLCYGCRGKEPSLSQSPPSSFSFICKQTSFISSLQFILKELLCDPQRTRNMGDLLHLHTAKIPVFLSGFRTKCDWRRYSLGNGMPHDEKMEWHSSQKGDIFIILCTWETSQKRLSGDIQPRWPILFIYLFSLSLSSFLESLHCWKYLEPLLTPGLPFQQAPILLLLTFLSTNWSPSAYHTAHGHSGCSAYV